MFEKIKALKKMAAIDATGNPVAAIVFQTVLSLVLMLLLDFESLVYYIAFTLSMFTVLTVAGMMILRYKEGKPAGYKAFGYPFTPLVFICATFSMGVFFVVSKTEESLFGMGTALLGGLLYFFSSDFKNRKTKK